MSTAVIWSKSKPDLEFQYRGHLGEFHGMSSQSHMPHCRVQSPGEINSWSCHTVRCKNSIRHIENRFRHILFLLFLMQFGLWRAAAFVSSPIHLGWYGQVLGVCQEFSARWRTGAAGPGTGLAPDFCISAWDIWRSYGRISMKFYASKITEKRVHGFAWNAACRQMSEHGRTDWLLSPIRIMVRMPEPDCFLRYHFSTAPRNITSGKCDVYVGLLAAAARSVFTCNMVLFSEPSKHVSRR